MSEWSLSGAGFHCGGSDPECTHLAAERGGWCAGSVGRKANGSVALRKGHGCLLWLGVWLERRVAVLIFKTVAVRGVLLKGVYVARREVVMSILRTDSDKIGTTPETNSNSESRHCRCMDCWLSCIGLSGSSMENPCCRGLQPFG